MDTPLRDHAVRLIDTHLAGRGSIQIDELADRFPEIPRIRLAAAMVDLIVSRRLRGAGNPRFEFGTSWIQGEGDDDWCGS